MAGNKTYENFANGILGSSTILADALSSKSDIQKQPLENKKKPQKEKIVKGSNESLRLVHVKLSIDTIKKLNDTKIEMGKSFTAQIEEALEFHWRHNP